MHASFHDGKGNGPIWIALHGSGLDDRVMPPFIRRFDPHRSILSVRGDLASESGFAFFRRRPDRSIDRDDLLERAHRLEDWIAGTVAGKYPKRPLWLCGFSNGAIMATALLLFGKSPFERAALYRPQPIADLAAAKIDAPTDVLVISGRQDRRRMPGDAAAAVEQLAVRGHKVRHHRSGSGHAPELEDIRLTVNWLALTSA